MSAYTSPHRGTLSEWSGKYWGVQVDPPVSTYKPQPRVVHLPDTNPDRVTLWRLSDYAVTSVTPFLVRLTPRATIRK